MIENDKTGAGEFPEWIDKLRTIAKTYANESDRAVAILAAAFLEHRLEEGLRALLVAGKVTDRLFEPYGPLSTFSAKIDFTYALGYVSEKNYRNLGLIRKIRNHFAHHPDITSFDASPVSDWARSLTLLPNIGAVLEPNPRERYTHVATLCIFLVASPMMEKISGRPTIPAVRRSAAE